jgi:hypothetical protein
VNSKENGQRETGLLREHKEGAIEVLKLFTSHLLYFMSHRPAFWRFPRTGSYTRGQNFTRQLGPICFTFGTEKLFPLIRLTEQRLARVAPPDGRQGFDEYFYDLEVRACRGEAQLVFARSSVRCVSRLPIKLIGEDTIYKACAVTGPKRRLIAAI